MAPGLRGGAPSSLQGSRSPAPNAVAKRAQANRPDKFSSSQIMATSESGRASRSCTAVFAATSSARSRTPNAAPNRRFPISVDNGEAQGGEGDMAMVRMRTGGSVDNRRSHGKFQYGSPPARGRRKLRADHPKAMTEAG